MQKQFLCVMQAVNIFDFSDGRITNQQRTNLTSIYPASQAPKLVATHSAVRVPFGEAAI